MAVRKRTWRSGDGEAKSAWVVDYRDQQGKRRLKTFKKKKLAKAWAEQAGYEVQQGTHTAASASITVKKAGQLWIKNAEADKLERATTRQYRQHLDLHIVPFLGTRKLSDLSVPAVKDFESRLREGLPRDMAEEIANARIGDKKVPAAAREELTTALAAPRSPAMVRKVVGSLGALLADAQEAGRVARNVVRERRPPRRHKAQAKRQKRRLEVGRDIPNPAEVKALLATAAGKARPIIVTAAFTGMRASELRGLAWDAVDLDGKVIHVRQRADCFNELGPPKSEAGQRSIPMTPALVNSLKEWKLACPRRGVIRDDDGNVVDPGTLWLVFPTGAGEVESHGNLYSRVFTPAWLAAGFAVESGDLDDGQPILKAKYAIHALRHFFASWILGEKARGGLEVSPKRAQVLLGHSSIQMTMDTYGHLLPPKGDEAEEFAAGEAALLS